MVNQINPERALVKDTHWIRDNFLAGSRNINIDVARFRRGSGYSKYTDTTLGGNFAINAPYQFTRYADPKEQRLMPQVGKGMGRWYSENIDDFGHNVHFRMGVPTYNSILGYISNAVDAKTAMYAATGREPGITSALGWVAGMVISVAFWELSVVAMLYNAANATSSRFTYVKPTMYQYWKTVQVLVNAITANLGITALAKPPVGTEEPSQPEIPDPRSLPNTWRGSGKSLSIDVFAVASRAQALQARWYLDLRHNADAIEKYNDVYQVVASAESRLRSHLSGHGGYDINPDRKIKTIKDYITAYTKHDAYRSTTDEEQAASGTLETALKAAAEAKENQSLWDTVKNKWQSTVDTITDYINDKSKDIADTMLSELRDGSQWVSFRVANSADSVSESVSNSTETSGIMDLFNSISGQARAVTFNLGGGTGIPLVDGVMGAAVNAVKEGFTSFTDNGGVTSFLNPVAAMMWGATIENPKRYASSSSTLPTASYRFELRCGYANNMSYVQDIIVPLCMLIAMAFPRGTGSQSFGAPFHVQYYSKGRSQCQIGIVSSINISRGVGNAPWLKNGLPMGVDVDITIEPFHEMLYVPLQQGIFLNSGKTFKSLMEENSMGDYIACLSGLGLVEQEYLGPQARRRINKLIKNFNSIKSPEMWAMAATNSIPGQWLTKFADVTSRR